MGRERLRQYAPEERTAPQRRPKKKPANQAPDRNGLIQAQPANPTPVEELRYNPAPFERIVAKISANGEGAKPAIARKPLSEQLIGPVPQREPDPAATSRSSNELGLVQRNPLPDRYASPMPAPTGGLVQRHPIPDRYAAPLPPIQAKLIVGPAKDRYADPAFLATGKPPIQAKLMVGPAKDRYEQEADQVASQVVQTINNPDTNSVQREDDDLSLQPQETLQRQDEEDDLQMKPEDSIQREDEEEEDLQMKPQETLQRVGSDGGAISSDLETEIQQAKGSGQPLDAGLQQSMGQAMGADFSHVKIHADSQADQLNRSIQAKAFTTGQDVFFRQGNYNPGSQGGQELIAHELTHVVQQGGAATSGQLQRFSLLDQDILQRDDDDEENWPAQQLNQNQDKTEDFETERAYAFQKEDKTRDFETEHASDSQEQKWPAQHLNQFGNKTKDFKTEYMSNSKLPDPNFGDVKVGAEVPGPVMFPNKKAKLTAEEAQQHGSVMDLGKAQQVGVETSSVMFPGKKVAPEAKDKKVAPGAKDKEKEVQQLVPVKPDKDVKKKFDFRTYIHPEKKRKKTSPLDTEKQISESMKVDEIKAYVQNIPLEEIGSVHDYQSQATFQSMNNYLRGTLGQKDGAAKRVLQAASALNRLPTAKGTVYRGIKAHSDDSIDFKLLKSWGLLKVGGIYTEKSFTSTTTNRRYWSKGDFSDGEVGMQIESEGGAKDLSAISSLEYEAEGEFTFTPGSEFKILGVTPLKEIITDENVDTIPNKPKVTEEVTPQSLEEDYHAKAIAIYLHELPSPEQTVMYEELDKKYGTINIGKATEMSVLISEMERRKYRLAGFEDSFYKNAFGRREVWDHFRTSVLSAIKQISQDLDLTEKVIPTLKSGTVDGLEKLASENPSVETFLARWKIHTNKVEEHFKKALEFKVGEEALAEEYRKQREKQRRKAEKEAAQKKQKDAENAYPKIRKDLLKKITDLNTNPEQEKALKNIGGAEAIVAETEARIKKEQRNGRTGGDLQREVARPIKKQYKTVIKIPISPLKKFVASFEEAFPVSVK